MAFIDGKLPLPTEPSVTTTLLYDTVILLNSGYQEQRYPRLTEPLAEIELSDVTFLEAELETFIDFFQNFAQGKLNTFRIALPFDNFAQSLQVTPNRALDDHLSTSGVSTYGAAVAIDADRQVVTTGSSTSFQLVKVYQYFDGANTYVNFRTVTKPQLNTLRLWDVSNVELVSGVGFTVDTSTGIVTTTDPQNITASGYLDAQFNFDVEARLDVDTIPQIILASGASDSFSSSTIVQRTCDVYKFNGLSVKEVPGYKIRKNDDVYDLFGSEAIDATLSLRMELDYKPTETVARKFQTRIEDTINKFESRLSYTTDDRFTLEYDSTLLRNIDSTKAKEYINRYAVAEYVTACFVLCMGRYRSLETLTFYNNDGSNDPVQYPTMRFDQDTITLQLLRDTDCELYSLDSIAFVEPKSAAKVITPGNTCAPTFPPAQPTENKPILVELTNNFDSVISGGLLQFDNSTSPTLNDDPNDYTRYAVFEIDSSIYPTLTYPLLTLWRDTTFLPTTSNAFYVTIGGYGGDPVVFNGILPVSLLDDGDRTIGAQEKIVCTGKDLLAFRYFDNLGIVLYQWSIPDFLPSTIRTDIEPTDSLSGQYLTWTLVGNPRPWADYDRPTFPEGVEQSTRCVRSLDSTKVFIPFFVGEIGVTTTFDWYEYNPEFRVLTFVKTITFPDPDTLVTLSNNYQWLHSLITQGTNDIYTFYPPNTNPAPIADPVDIDYYRNTTLLQTITDERILFLDNTVSPIKPFVKFGDKYYVVGREATVVNSYNITSIDVTDGSLDFNLNNTDVGFTLNGLIPTSRISNMATFGQFFLASGCNWIANTQTNVSEALAVSTWHTDSALTPTVFAPRFIEQNNINQAYTAFTDDLITANVPIHIITTRSE